MLARFHRLFMRSLSTPKQVVSDPLSQFIYVIPSWLDSGDRWLPKASLLHHHGLESIHRALSIKYHLLTDTVGYAMCHRGRIKGARRGVLKWGVET
jgi:hypothetical protein